MNKDLKYIKRNDINVVKYDNCIANAMNSRIYAYSWYLDIVANDWGVLVKGDYEIVMPIPYMRAKKNLYKKKIIQPLYCQQLGVFYTSQISQEDFDIFFDNFEVLQPRSYSFNAENFCFLDGTKQRVNYELDLNRDFDKIYSGYSKNLKRNLKKSLKNQLKITKDIGVNDFISLKKSYKKHPVTKKNFQTLKDLSEKIIEKGMGTFIGVTSEKEIYAIGFFTKTNTRIIYLLSVSTFKGKEKGAASHLFDFVIRNNIEKNIVLDFEGSMIPGVARFFKSFGAKMNNYYLYTKLF